MRIILAFSVTLLMALTAMAQETGFYYFTDKEFQAIGRTEMALNRGEITELCFKTNKFGSTDIKRRTAIFMMKELGHCFSIQSDTEECFFVKPATHCEGN